MRSIVFGSLATAAWIAGCGSTEPNVLLLTNPDFTTNTNGWSAEDPASATVAWNATDANGASNSGSAVVTNTSVGPSNGSGIIQCVTAITAGGSYTFGGSVRLPTGQSRTGDLQIGLRWRAGSNCSGSVVGSQPRVSHAAPGNAWVYLTSQVFVAPAGVASADFIAFPSKVEAGGSLAGHFDLLFLYRVDVSQ